MADILSREARLLSSIETGRCPICRMLQKDEFDLLCHWVGASGEGEEVNLSRKLKGRGFCDSHLWMLAEINAPGGNARVAYALLSNDLERGDLSQDPSGYCPVCEEIVQLERGDLDLLANRLESEALQRKYADSLGLCGAHFSEIMARIKNSKLRRFLRDIHQAQRQRLLLALEGFLKKQSPEARQGQTEDEKRASSRAFERLVGRSRILKVF